VSGLSTLIGNLVRSTKYIDIWNYLEQEQQLQEEEEEEEVEMEEYDDNEFSIEWAQQQLNAYRKQTLHITCLFLFVFAFDVQ